MCVITSTVATTAITIATAVLSTAAGVHSAITKSKVAKLQAEQNIQQAKIAERNAAYERQEGIEDARHKKLKAIQNMEGIKTQLASGNILTSSETSLNLMDDEKLSGEIDALKLIDNAERRAQSYLNSAQNLYFNAGLREYNSNQMLINQGLSAADSMRKQISKNLEKK